MTVPAMREPDTPSPDAASSARFLDGKPGPSRDRRRSGSAGAQMIGNKMPAAGDMMKSRTVHNVTDPSGLKLMVSRDTDMLAFSSKLCETPIDQQVRRVEIELAADSMQPLFIPSSSTRHTRPHFYVFLSIYPLHPP